MLLVNWMHRYGVLFFIPYDVNFIIITSRWNKLCKR